MAQSTTISEADIFANVVAPGDADFTPDAAKTILSWKFDSVTRKRIRTLLEKNSRGTISAAERLDLEKFLRVGQFLDLLHAKAKLSLKQSRIPT